MSHHDAHAHPDTSGGADATATVSRNDDENRYEIHVDGTLAGFSEFRRDAEDRLVFAHTSVDSAFEGQGLGSELVHGAMVDVAARGETVVPRCPFVAHYLTTQAVDGLDVFWPEQSHDAARR